jgi:hypothetical protein
VIDGRTRGEPPADGRGRPGGGGGHVFTLYVASQDPVPLPDDGPPTEPGTTLGFLRGDGAGPSDR